MKTKILSVIVTCSSLLLVQGFDLTSSYENGTVDLSRRIINGDRANPENFRYLALTVAVVGESRYLCGGGVISNHFILTAAHCMYDKICRFIEVFPSTWHPGDVADLHVINCYPHEMSTGRNYFYDIGLLETIEDLLMDGRFARIDLPYPGTIYGPGDEAIIVGWGLLEDGSVPDHLMSGESPVYSWDECNYAYGNAKACTDNMNCPVRRIPDHVFCTLGKPKKFPGPCLGDSGGPVVINGELAGVISGIIWSQSRLCEAGNPGLNIDVSYFIPWIDKHIRFDRGTR